MPLFIVKSISRFKLVCVENTFLQKNNIPNGIQIHDIKAKTITFRKKQKHEKQTLIFKNFFAF